MAEIIDGREVARRVNGVAVAFTRRRYGRQSYCWADVYVRGRWVCLGDPWPAVNWRRAELQKEVERVSNG